MLSYRTLLRCKQINCIFGTQRRNIRGVRKIFRQNLPRYRNSLMDLRNWEEMPGAEEVSLRELWNSRIDFYKLYMPTNQAHTLLEALFNPNNDIDHLLKIIDENLQTMNSFYVATSFEALNDMMRLGVCDIDTVLVSPELKNLCKRALFKLRFFEADEVLKFITCLSTMKMPDDTLIVQSALQMARHLLNDFSANELMALEGSLANLEITDHSQKSLLSALKEATKLRLIHKKEQVLELEANKQIDSKT